MGAVAAMAYEARVSASVTSVRSDGNPLACIDMRFSVELPFVPMAGTVLRIDDPDYPENYDLYEFDTVAWSVQENAFICVARPNALEDYGDASISELFVWFDRLGLQPAFSELPELTPRLAGSCPQCGFSYRWNGLRCEHCGFVQDDSTGDVADETDDGFAEEWEDEEADAEVGVTSGISSRCHQCQQEFVSSGDRAFCPKCHKAIVERHARWEAALSGLRQGEPEIRAASVKPGPIRMNVDDFDRLAEVESCLDEKLRQGFHMLGDESE